jgi:N2-(2-carboxyethyl)arginine synthase
MKFSKLLLLYLKSIGIKRIFGIVGREGEAISFTEVPGIEFILTRHEMTAGIAAISVSRFTKAPQICFGTLGPGITHYMTALATASLDRYPLILIVAQLETSSLNYDNAHQCLDNIRIAQTLCKFSKEINNPSEIKDALESAVEASMTLPYGPSVISIPIDVLSSDATEISKKYGTVLNGKILSGKNEKTKVSQPDIKKIVEIIKGSEKNLIVIGDATVKIKGLPEQIKKLSKQTNIPVISTYSAKGVMGYSNKLSFGVINSYMNVITEQKAIEAIFNDIDNLIMIGYDLSEHYPFAWTRGKKKTIISLNAYEYSGRSINPDLNITGDLSEILNLLLKQLINVHKVDHPHLEMVRKQIDKISNETKEYEQGVTPVQLLRILNSHFNNDYIMASDVGMHRHVSSIFYNAKLPEDFVTSPGLSSFGTGLPFGIGAKIANPTRNVVVIAGDGGFHSSSGDIETIVRQKLKVLIIILNSSSNTLIERYELTGNDRTVNKATTSFGYVDFVKLAEANGCPATHAKNIGQIERALLIFDKSNQPLLIEIPVYYPKMYINEFAKIFEKKD